MSDDQPSRARRLLQSIRKEIPEALAEGQDHDDAEVAAMLRELGIALVESEQPTQLVAARLLTIAKQYTSETVRVVVLPPRWWSRSAPSPTRSRRSSSRRRS